MEIECKLGLMKICSDSEIENIILECAAGLDEIFIYGSDEYPYLALLVNGERAVLHYFSSRQCGSYQSIGNDNIDEATKFIISGETWTSPNYAVVTLNSAIECAKQFVNTQQIPSCIEWNEL